MEEERTLEISIRMALTEDDLEHVRVLLREYAKLIRETICVQGFQLELDHLSEEYGPPRGHLLLAHSGTVAAGCVAIRQIDAERCEMRRLYVRPAYRRSGIGRRLASRIIEEAQNPGGGALDTTGSSFIPHAVTRTLRHLSPRS